VPEERGDGFETHASVDGLGRQCVTELVWVDVTDAGAFGDACDETVDGAALDGGAVIGDEAALGADVVGVGGDPVGEESDELGVQWDEPVVAELADGDSQPVGVTDLGHGVSGEVAKFAGA
jgi:hypothetical protein